MVRFRFIHAADLHLDTPFRGTSSLPEPFRTQLRESTFAAFANLVQLAISENIDFVVLAGDIYDAADRSLRAQLRFQRGLQQLQEHRIPVFIVHGNHDPANGPQADLQWPELVHIFGTREVTTAIAYRGGRVEEPLAAVCGISYANAALQENVALQYQRQAGSSLYHIGLLHGNVDGDPLHDNYAPCSKQDLIASGLDYWALGHIHLRQLLAESRPMIVYPGNIQARSMKETGTKGCYIVEVSEQAETKLTFQALDTVRFEAVHMDLQDISSEQELKDQLELQLELLREWAEGRMSIVRLIVTGRTSLHHKLGQAVFQAELIQMLREEELVRAERRSGGADLVWIDSLQVETGLPLDLELLKQEESFVGELFRLSIAAEEDEAACDDMLAEALSHFMNSPRLRHTFSEMKGEEGRSWLSRAREMAAVLLDEEGLPKEPSLKSGGESA